MGNDLTHYGVLGMKWGHRKQREAEYRQKLSNTIGKLEKQGLGDSSDAKRFKYRNQHVAARVGKTAASVTAQILIGEIFKSYITGKPLFSDTDLKKTLKRVSVNTAYSVALNDALAKSASKKYTQSGRSANNVGFMRSMREDAMQTGLRAAMRAAPLARYMLGIKASQARMNRARNEAIFKQWGANILTDKVVDHIWNVEYTVS